MFIKPSQKKFVYNYYRNKGVFLSKEEIKTMEQFRKGLLRIIILSVGICLVQNSVYTKSMSNKYHSAIHSQSHSIKENNFCDMPATTYTISLPTIIKLSE